MLRPYTAARRQFPPHRRPANRQIATVIRLDQHADGPAARLRRQPPTRRADTALPSKGNRPSPSTNRAFLYRSTRRALDRAKDVGFGNGSRPDVVQVAVVRL